ncbi:MAG: glucose-6-phosphate isomerase [Xanthomonadaceae bacterium]|jgi:glucose-6-phosphate isomerase|nr:glucose-6-phosphate isomerase [Xanthomonadaceae bacterium]
MSRAARFDLLKNHAARLRGKGIARLLQEDAARAQDFASGVGPLYVNFGRQTYDRQAWADLLALADAADVPAAFRRLFDGERINVTEDRAALHTALRSDLSSAPAAQQAHRDSRTARQRMYRLAEVLEASDVTDIVSIGIGGSDLGPRLVVDALRAPIPRRFRVHFISNVDGAAAARTLAALDSRRTAVILISKTFSTQETLFNGRIVRDWLGDSERLYAVSANPDKAAAAFAIAPERMLPIWDWVGGRYSLWSATGFPIALAIGNEGFEQLLAGAAGIDVHVLRAPLADNLAVRHALTAIWNRNGLGLGSQAVMSYDQRLALLPAYLQQLVMESLGKRVETNGSPIQADTVPVWWGGAGTDVQHSFFQALHQGSSIVPADFIGVIRGDDPYPENHRALLANLLAQTEALANGQPSEDPHRFYPGGRPSTLLLLDRLDPYSLGMLLALYEHSVYVQSVLWGINAFDQFGVELGKQVANRLLPVLGDPAAQVEDPVTRALIERIRNR